MAKPNRSAIERFSGLLLAGVFALSVCTSASSAADEQKIRELIQLSQIVPIDYRQHVNIVAKDDSVLISVYKDPDAEPNDCKIDAILMSEKVREAAPDAKTVSVFFYDLAADDRILQVDVPVASVAAFAEGSLNKAGVLKAAKLTTKQTNTLAASYSGRTYKQIVERLGVLPGPSQQQRALALVRINELTVQGKDTADLKRKYLHVEDLTRRKNFEEMRGELVQLETALNAHRENDWDTKLESLAAGAKATPDSPNGTESAKE